MESDKAGSLRVSGVRVLGIEISAVDMNRACALVAEWARHGTPATVAVAAVHSVVDAQDDPVARRAMQQASLCLPDGVPLVWLCRLAGHRNTRRVFGPDFMLALSRHLSADGAAAFYLGGAPGVAEDLAARMERSFPGLRTAGTLAPPFRALSDAETGGIIDAINASDADVLWVGLGSPRQERWIGEHRDRLKVPVLIGVGAAFDYNTGRIRRAPRWMQACALEWLYRLIQEPRRLWRRYLRNNPLFVWYLILERLGWKRFD